MFLKSFCDSLISANCRTQHAATRQCGARQVLNYLWWLQPEFFSQGEWIFDTARDLECELLCCRNLKEAVGCCCDFYPLQIRVFFGFHRVWLSLFFNLSSHLARELLFKGPPGLSWDTTERKGFSTPSHDVFLRWNVPGGKLFAPFWRCVYIDYFNMDWRRTILQLLSMWRGL